MEQFTDLINKIVFFSPEGFWSLNKEGVINKRKQAGIISNIAITKKTQKREFRG